MRSLRRALPWVGAGVAGTLAIALAVRPAAEPRCGPGFLARGTRCCPPGGARSADADVCPAVAPCPSPLVAVDGGCDAPDELVRVEATRFVLGPSDWEAQGVVAPRVVAVGPFRIDRFEVTIGKLARHPKLAPRFARELAAGDLARAAYGVLYEEAADVCSARGGRLPSTDEWLAAAAGSAARRYPWGDTGAVCRRGAWGLAAGPCGEGASLPDTAGAHPSGRTPTGIDDLAGNVAEWVMAPSTGDGGADRREPTRGGSFRTSFAGGLRTWAETMESPLARKDHVGFRCAFDP